MNKMTRLHWVSMLIVNELFFYILNKKTATKLSILFRSAGLNNVKCSRTKLPIWMRPLTVCLTKNVRLDWSTRKDWKVFLIKVNWRKKNPFQILVLCEPFAWDGFIRERERERTVHMWGAVKMHILLFPEKCLNMESYIDWW